MKNSSDFVVYYTMSEYQNSHLRVNETINLESGEYIANLTVFVPAYPELGTFNKIKKFGKLIQTLIAVSFITVVITFPT